MNILDRIILAFFPAWAARRAHNKFVARQFTGADLDRLRSRASYSSVGPIQENRASRKNLLDTARNLDRNNSFAHGAFNALVNNIVGRGINLECRVKTAGGKLIETVNRKIEEVWKDWAVGIDINQQMSFSAFQQLVERELWVAGECLIAKIVPGDKRPVPLALELIESERLAALDSDDSARIIQGVEYGKSGNITAYHIYSEHPSDSISPSDPKRIPVSNVLHIYHSTRPNQVRGLSRVAPVARNFEALNQFMDHELTKARIASSFALMIKRGGLGLATKFPSSGAAGATYDANGYPTDSNNNPMAYLEGGMIFTGGPNDSLEGTGPSIQVSAFAEFVATNLRAIATGLNMSYELLARDFTQTNFSSARQSSLEDKRHWEPRQQLLIDRCCNPVFRWFVDACIMAGIRPFSANENRILVEWITPPREYVDPQKEVEADIQAVKAGFTNLQKIASKHGTDVHENIRLNAQIAKEAEEQDLVLDSVSVKEEPPEPPPVIQGPEGTDNDGQDNQAMQARAKFARC